MAGPLRRRAVISALMPTRTPATKAATGAESRPSSRASYTTYPTPPRMALGSRDFASVRKRSANPAVATPATTRSKRILPIVMRRPPFYRHSARTAPTPAAMATALSRASAVRATPETRSPLTVSRMALVMARPGRSGMIAPMMMEVWFPRG